MYADTNEKLYKNLMGYGRNSVFITNEIAMQLMLLSK